MPWHRRRDLIDHSTVGAYHCFPRCVRRAFLCGEDVSGLDLGHRRDWVRERLEALASVFAIALAVGANVDYVTVREADGTVLTLAAELAPAVLKPGYTLLQTRKGSALARKAIGVSATMELDVLRHLSEAEREERARFAYEACVVARERMIPKDVFHHWGWNAASMRAV